MHSCFSQILVYYFCIPAYILRDFCLLHLFVERGGGDIYSLRLGRGLQHKDVIRLTFPLREGSTRGATFCGAGTATGGLVSVVFSNMLRKAARNENSQQLIRKLIPSQSQHQQQQQGVKRNKKKEEENDNKIMDMQLQQNSNYRKYNSNSVPLNRRNQNIYIIDKYIEL